MQTFMLSCLCLYGTTQSYSYSSVVIFLAPFIIFIVVWVWLAIIMAVDHFKEEFKRYKKKSADLREVLDARDPKQAKNFIGTELNAI